MIKLIIFDLGKVILDFSLSMIAEGFARHSNNYLYAILRYSRLYARSGNDITVSYETGRIKSDDVYNYIKDFLLISLFISLNRFGVIFLQRMRE